MPFVQHFRASTLVVAILLAIVPGTAATQLVPGTIVAKEEAVALLPQPIRLTASWWAFLDVSGEKLAERATQMQSHLHTLESDLEPTDREQSSAVFDEIEQSLKSYVALKSREPEQPKAAPPSPEHLSLAEYMDLAALLRENSLQLELEEADIERQEDDVKAGYKRYDDLLAAYLSLESSAPTRLDHGMVLIRARLRLALAEQQLRLQKPLLAHTRKTVDRLRKAVSAASTRIQVDASHAARYSKDLVKAQRTLATLQSEATFARLRDRSKEADSPREWDRARLQTQTLLNFDVRIAEAELAVLRERLSLALVRYLLDPTTEFEADTDPQSILRTQTQFLGRVDGQIDAWRVSTDRERAAATSKLALSEGANAAIAEVQRARINKADDNVRSLMRLSEQTILAESLARIVGAQIAREEGRLAVWTEAARNSIADGFKTAVRFSTASLVTVNDTPVTLLGLLRMALILTVAWWISKLLRQLLDRTSSRRQTMNRASMYTLGRLFHYVILALGILIALSSIGIDVTKFALLLSAVGIGLGFGLQAIFNNFVAGLIILFEKSLKVGDFVDLESGVRGEVREINIRSTLVTTNDNVDILVPNSEFVNGRVTNWTLRDAYLRLRIPFGVAFGTDKDSVRQAGLEAAGAVEHHLNEAGRRAPQVWLVGFGDNGLQFELVVWLLPDAVRRPNAVHAAYYWAIESGLRKHGIKIGLPQRALHLQSGFPLAAQPDLMRTDPHPAIATSSDNG